MFSPHNYKYGTLQLQFLDTVGNGTGSIDMNVDGSVTPVPFRLRGPTGFASYIESVSMFIRHSGPLAANEYGGLPTLANGVLVQIKDPEGNIISDITDQFAIKNNADWLAYSFRINLTEFAGGAQVLSLSYNMSEQGRPIYIGPGYTFNVIVRDNLTAVPQHYFRVSLIAAPLNR